MRLTIEMHEHGREVIDLTGHVRQASWTSSTSAPWSAISLVMHLPKRAMGEIYPQVGAWLVIRDQNEGRALAWGYIDAVSGGIHTGDGGVIVSDFTQVRAVGWLQFLGRVQAFVQPGITEGSVGTLFQIHDWEAAFKAIISAFEGNLGLSLERLVRELARVYLPETLSREMLATAVRVVYDESTRSQFAPRRPIDRVPGLALPNLASAFPSGPSVLSLMQQTFGADPMLVEMFESLEEPGWPAAPEEAPAPQRPEFTGIRGARSAEERLGIKPSPQLGRKLRRAMEAAAGSGAVNQAPALASDTAKRLGLNPVLVYRMRPWRPVDLTVFRTLTNTLPMNAQLFDETMFRGVTWDTESGARVEADRVKRVAWEFSDGRRVNCVAPGLPSMPDSPVGFWQRSALPLMDEESILRHGLRVYRPAWPFWPSDAATSQQASLLASLRTLAAQAAQLAAGGQRYAEGAVTIGGYYPGARAGAPIEIELGDSLGGVAPGELLTGYAETVTHSVTLERGGHARGETTVEYSRGLFDESQRAIRGEIGFVRRAEEKSTKSRLERVRMPRPGGMQR